MSRNKKKHADKIDDSPADVPIPENINIQSPSILLWLISTLLFCLFASTIAPIFISFGKAAQVPSTDLMHQILGVTGICAYLIVPVYLTIYKRAEEDDKPHSPSYSFKKPSTIKEEQGLISFYINYALLIIIGLPVIGLTFFKPVFRALILLFSFSYLGLPGGESRLFVIIVMSDILITYMNMIFPKWGFNPAEIVAVALRIKDRPLLVNLCTVFYIFYTAIIFFFISSIGNNTNTGHHYIKGEREILLTGSWIFATLYTRLPFIMNAFEGSDILGYLKKMSGRYIIFQIAILAISFIAYIWPYFISWR